MEEKKEEAVNTEVNQEKPAKKSKKGLVILIIILVALLAGGGVAAWYFLANGDGDGDETSYTVKDGKEKIKISKSESSTVTYDTYDNGLVSFEYPSGWTVEICPTDYIHYCFKVYNPENPTYMFLFGLKQEGALKSEKARQVYAKLYPDAPFSKMTPIDPQTTEGFYKAWNGNSDYNNNGLGTNFFMHLDNFEVVENLGQDMVGGDVLRATYTDSKGNKAQGIFTAAVKDVGSYYISEDMWNPFGAQVDVWPLNTYNICIMSAPDDDFINWQAHLDHCLGTIQFSQQFINGFNSQEDALLSSVKANQKIYDSISDSIMSSWEARNNSYDIISQKQSDATLGYERVYDTETGDIYKAYNGFTDDYSGDRYQPITDDMYTQATAGYIEK